MRFCTLFIITAMANHKIDTALAYYHQDCLGCYILDFKNNLVQFSFKHAMSMYTYVFVIPPIELHRPPT